jgi:tRNA A-37 threonylcarbamoyl transferase component Bud32
MSSQVRIDVGGIRWQVVPKYRDRLFGPQGLRLDEWLRTGAAQVVKQAPHRTIYRVTLPGLDFYLKHYPVGDVRGWLRQLIRPSKARTEYRRALAVAGRRVPTVEPLALGERGHVLRPGESFLITRTLGGTQPLNCFLEETLPALPARRQANLRRRLAGELGKLIARMHDAGMTHNDLHPANVLIHLGANDRPQLHVIDLHAVRLGRPLGWRASRDNLVMLNRWFMLRAGRADRLRFWRAYCAERAGPNGGRNIWGTAARAPRSTSGVIRELERRTGESNWQFWKNRDRRSRATNRYYRRVRSGVAAGFAVTDLDRDDLAKLLADPDAPFGRPGVTLLKDSRSSTVAEMDLAVGGVVRRVIYKRFRVTAWSDPWAALVRPSPALRSWVLGHGLRERGLPTARPLAVFHRHRHGLAYEGYLLTEKIENAVDLHQCVAGLGSFNVAERRTRLRCLIDHVARLVRELHQRRLAHRDLKAVNILVAAPDFAVWLIDLVGVRNRHRLPRRRRVQNLARLNASFWQDSALTRADRLRFLRVYLQWGLRGRETWKRWWHEVGEATREKVNRNRQSGRPLA